jgi:hypothetical protein
MSDFETYYSSDIIDLFTDLKLYCENNALDLLNKRDNDMGYYFFKLIFKHAVLKDEIKEEKTNDNDELLEYS